MATMDFDPLFKRILRLRRKEIPIQLKRGTEERAHDGRHDNHSR